MSQFKPAIHYLPHDTPMVLLDNVEAITEEMAICCVTITQTGIVAPFLNKQNELPAWFVMEMMAQTIGVWRGWHAKIAGSEAKIGLLLGVRGFKSSFASYPLATKLQIKVKLVLQDSKLANFECQALIANNVVVEARLNVYQPDDQEIEKLIIQA